MEVWVVLSASEPQILLIMVAYVVKQLVGAPLRHQRGAYVKILEERKEGVLDHGLGVGGGFTHLEFLECEGEVPLVDPTQGAHIQEIGAALIHGLGEPHLFVPQVGLGKDVLVEWSKVVLDHQEKCSAGLLLRVDYHA
jgi:hypothetical protein